MEKRHNYVRKVAELATQFYITNDRVLTYHTHNLRFDPNPKPENPTPRPKPLG